MNDKEYNVSLNSTIEFININGEYIHLASAVKLSGQINRSALLATYQVNNSQSNQQQGLDLHKLQIGVDEAGRGPLLGSVNVAAAILPNAWSGMIENRPLQDTPLSMLTDSKQLSEKKRDTLYPLVQQYALGYIIADVPAVVIDQLNILQATMLGMRLCTEALLESIAQNLAMIVKTDINAPKPLQIAVLYDGNRCPELDYAKISQAGLQQADIDCQAWVKGDARHTNIAAASILAKVSRDQAMYQLHTQYPQYGIAQHKGYPTKAHIQAIEKYGVLTEHRRSFAPVAKKIAESEELL